MKKILIISSDKHLLEVLDFCFKGWGYEVFLQNSLTHDILSIKKLSPDVIVADLHTADKSQLEVCCLLKDDFTTAFIPIITLINKRQLRDELLNIKQGVDDYLIKPPDPLDLRVRIEMAIRRSQYSYHANPLTGLPGTRVLEEILITRLEKNTPFVFGYIDIDRFKYFNDIYGYIKGDRVILHTAYMLYTAVDKFGSESDFIGHIGGDDFVFVIEPRSYMNICQNFLRMFDYTIPFHYSKEDRKNGYIIARTRSGEIRKVPLMSITAALVHYKEDSTFKSIIEVNEKVTEIKKYLKTVPGSKFMADRRTLHKADIIKSNIPSKKNENIVAYRPMGEILLERNLISREQLDEALAVHWKRGIALGEVLKEFEFIEEKEFLEALRFQKSTVSGFSTISSQFTSGLYI